MTDPITTPAQMREAAARLADETHRAYIAAKGRNPDDYVSEYSKLSAAIRALPVAEPLCTWPSCGHTAKGQCRTYTSGQLIAPNDASITATNTPVAEPEPVAVNAVMCAAERDAQSRDAVDLTLFRQAIRAEALEEAAKLADAITERLWHEYKTERHFATDHLQGMSDGAGEVADAIRALMEKPE